MKLIIILFQLAIIHNIFGQITFSKIYDLDTKAVRNGVHDFEIMNNNLFIYTAHLCPIFENTYRTCVGLAKFDMNGNLIHKIILDTLDSTECCSEGLTTDGKNLFMSTYAWGEFKIQGKTDKISVIDFDSNLDQLKIQKYSEESLTSSGLINSGIEYLNNSIFIYGSIKNKVNTPDSVHIIKTDIYGNELNRFYYSYGNSSLYVNNLQATPDGNLAFILKIKSQNGANNGFDGYQLMKVDSFGNVLDSFIFKDILKQPNRLLATSDGGFAFSSIDHPITGGDIFTTGYGLINKMNANMDTLEWTLILPNNQMVDGRHYSINDYIEANNGDIVACGMVYDNTDTELSTGIPDKNSTWNGFVIRITVDGDIKWLHLYKNPNDLLPNDEYGRFRPSTLVEIKELPDGRFIVAGAVFFNGRQYSALNEFETEAFHLWLLMVDENGCLEKHDCEEIIRLGQNTNSTFAIGNEWIYEEETYFGGGNTEVGYRSFFIKDTLFDGLHTKYVLGIQDTFYVEDNKMYFWDEHYQEYVMYYDWQSTTSYKIKYFNQFMNSEEVATVNIDSISYRYFGNDSLKVQHIRIENSGTFEEYKDVVYDGVGAGYFGIKLLLGCGLCDDHPYTTKLRCFTNDNMTYQFEPYACDSTWILTSTIEVDPEKVIIYPNPTNGQVNIFGINSETEYELYTINGQVLKKGKTKNKKIELNNNGLFFIKLKVDENWVIKRIVKLE